MTQSRVACALAAAALSVLLLTGCAGGEPGVAQTPSEAPSTSAVPSTSEAPSATPTPTPSPASAAGPAVNIPVPEKPALADENSVEGLEAFTEWWFELLNYAYATNDLEPLWAVTDEGCTTCQNIEDSIAQVYADGGWMSGGFISLESFDTKFRKNVHGSVDSFVTIVQEPMVAFNQDGEVLAEAAEATEPDTNATITEYLDGDWILADFGEINTGE